MTTYPVDTNFDGNPVGELKLTVPLSNMHEYFLAPAYAKSEESGEFETIHYSLIHRSLLPTEKQMIEKEGAWA